MGMKRALLLALLILALLRLDCAAQAGNAYAVPFYDKPDWYGFTTAPRASGAGIVHTAPVMNHLIILVTINSPKTVDSHIAARIAYENLFGNLRQLPAGPLYIVVVIYGPLNSINLHPQYGFVFKRNSGRSGGWIPRPISDKELLAVQCAIGQCPNHRPAKSHGNGNPT